MHSSPSFYRQLTRPSLLSTSHGDLPCVDPSNVSFGFLAETQSFSGYEPKDLTEKDTSGIGQTDDFPQIECDVDL